MRNIFQNSKSNNVARPEVPATQQAEDTETTEHESAPSDEAEKEDKFDANLALTPLKMGAPNKSRGRRSSVRMRVVASGAMNDLNEEIAFPDSDDDENDDGEEEAEELSEEKTTRSIISLPNVVKDDEIEIKISGPGEQAEEKDVEKRSTPPATSSPPHVEALQTHNQTNVAHATQRALDKISNEDAEGFSDFVFELEE